MITNSFSVAFSECRVGCQIIKGSQSKLRREREREKGAIDSMMHRQPLTAVWCTKTGSGRRFAAFCASTSLTTKTMTDNINEEKERLPGAHKSVSLFFSSRRLPLSFAKRGTARMHRWWRRNYERAFSTLSFWSSAAIDEKTTYFEAKLIVVRQKDALEDQQSWPLSPFLINADAFSWRN